MMSRSAEVRSSGRVQSVPFVSVVIPTFNRTKALTRCLEGLATQTYPKDRFEVVVVDDGGSTDLEEGLPRGAFPGYTRLLRQPNQGPAAARNLGAREARGDILAFTDDDCRPRSPWISALVETIVREPKAMVGGRVVNGLSSNLYAQASQDLVSFLYEYFPRTRALRPFFTTNNVGVRRTSFLDIGGFDESFRFSAGEDRDLSERWAAEIGPLRVVEGAVVEHFHDLTFPRFIRQHHTYGRGAITLARRREERGHGKPFPEPLGFYARMLAFPIRGKPLWKGLPLAVLVALAQVAGLVGMAKEGLSTESKHRRSPTSLRTRDGLQEVREEVL